MALYYRTPLRVCFAPVTLLGFLLFRGFPPLVAEHLSVSRPLLALPSNEGRLQGFERPKDPCSQPKPIKVLTGRSSLELYPLQGTRLHATGTRFQRRLPSCAFNHNCPKASADHRSKVLRHEQVGLPLSRVADPPEVVVLVFSLTTFGLCLVGLMVSPWRVGASLHPPSLL